MKKKLNIKLNDALDKKVNADNSWQRTYESLEEKVDIDRICLWMDMCNRTETILLYEQTQDRQRKIQRIHIDEDSSENAQLEAERITKLRFIQDLINSRSSSGRSNENARNFK